MATSSAYREGSIKTIVAGSGETLGTGATLLNNNFTELYDLVKPSTTGCNNEVIQVAGYGASGMATYNTIGLNYCGYSGSSAVPVLTGGSSIVITPISQLTNGTGCSELFGEGDISRTRYSFYPGSAYQESYWVSGSGSGGDMSYYSATTSSYWASYYDDGGSYNKTYRKTTDSSTLNIPIPDFGTSLVSGTLGILSSYEGSEYGDMKLYRFNLFIRDTSMLCGALEEWNGSAWGQPSSSLSVTISNNKITQIVSDSGTKYYIDATIVGGTDAPVNYVTLGAGS